MLDENRTEDLAVMYSLFSRVSALQEMRTAFNSYVKVRTGADILGERDTLANLHIIYQAKGTSLVSDPSKDETMVPSLIAFQDSLTALITTSFASDDLFRSSLRDGFSSFINKRQNKPAEMIAKFIDAKMKSGNKAMSEEELEKTFRSTLVLFRYCQGKDIFEAF